MKNKWFVKTFQVSEIIDAYNWIEESPYHIALHRNPDHSFAYHVMGSDMDTLIQFSRLARCTRRMLSVLSTHGTKVRKGKTIYHYDDWRHNVKYRYQSLIERLNGSH